jgi:hypothetical protein
MREREVEAYLVREVKRRSGDTRKLKFVGHNGAPDRLLLFPRIHWHALAETKKPKGGILEAHQIREHARLRDAGFEVYEIYTKDDVDALFGMLFPEGIE